MNKNRRRSLLQIERLEGRQLLSVVVAERENNNKAKSANVFAFDTDGIAQLQGTSQSKADRDYFRFTAPGSGPMGFAVRTRNGVFAQLEVENAAGVALFETRPRDGLNVGAVDLVAGQSYVVRLRSPINAKAAYSADFALGGAPAGGTGPGSTGNPAPVGVVGESKNDDSPDHTNPVTLSTDNVIQLRGSVTKADRDYYAVVAPATGTLNVSARSTNGVLAKVEVQDANRPQPVRDRAERRPGRRFHRRRRGPDLVRPRPSGRQERNRRLCDRPPLHHPDNRDGNRHRDRNR